MLATKIIVPIEELEWINTMVWKDKKIGGICMCINLGNLNDVCVHDPFPIPFIDEILENVGGREVYSFTNGSSCYHLVKIKEEGRHKMTFVIEWG